MKHPLITLFTCENFKKTEKGYTFYDCKLKVPIRDPKLECDSKKTFSRITWETMTNTLTYYKGAKKVYKNTLVVNNVPRYLDTTKSKSIIEKENKHFEKIMDTLLKKQQIEGLCYVSCLELPDSKIVYLLGESHIKHSCGDNFTSLGKFLYNEILLNKWKYFIDFIIEQNVENSLIDLEKQMKDKKRKFDDLSILWLRGIISNTCDDNKSFKIDQNVKIHRNDIRGTQFSINTMSKMFKVMNRQFENKTINDDAYIILREFIKGLRRALYVKNIHEFYIKFPWVRELSTYMSHVQHVKYEQVIELEFIPLLNKYKKSMSIFDKYKLFSDLTLLLNDIYTLGLIMTTDIHRCVIYTGYFHSDNLENLLTKYMHFRIKWNSKVDNICERKKDEECDFEQSCCYNKKKIIKKKKK